MPIIKSAIKRMKQTAVRRARNVETKKSVKTAVRAFTDKPSAKLLSEAQSAIDTAVKKNVLNKSTAARRKSSLSRLAKEAGVKLEAAKKTATSAVKATPAKKAVTKKAAPAKKTPAKKAAPATKKAPAKKPAAK